jgi:hypothetical protein
MPPIDIAARCLLIEDGNQFFDTPEWETNSLKNFMGTIRLGTHSLDNSLAKYGFHRDDITDVFMTPLHLTIAEEYTNKDKTGYEPAFKKLKF